MNTIHCTCRTAALRIFVRSLVGPVSAATAIPLASTLTTSTAASTAERQWRLFTTGGGRSVTRPGIGTRMRAPRLLPLSRPTAAKAMRISGRLPLSAAAAASERETALGLGGGGPAMTPAVSTMRAIDDDVVQPADDAIPPAPALAAAATPTPTPTGDVSENGETQASKLGKNQRKRLRRQREEELMRAAAKEVAAAAADMPTEPANSRQAASEEPTPLSKRQIRKRRKAAKLEQDGTDTSETQGRPEKTTDAQRTKSKGKKARRVEVGVDAGVGPDGTMTAADWGAADAAAVSGPTATTARRRRSRRMADTLSVPGQPDRPAGQADQPDRPREPWQVQKHALRTKFPEGWKPRKKLSPDALEGIRALHQQFPATYTTAVLAQHFQVSPEAIRRILKSKWQTSAADEEDRQMRWFDRGKKVWARWAALGKKPPKKWQAEGIRRDASWTGRRQRLQARRETYHRQLVAEGVDGVESIESTTSEASLPPPRPQENQP